ncbi:hypothetical protein QR692_00460 [Lactococcus petauri]|uniref:hypothetical protein n=1 Tax=Lactococcus petauri TaxID=1940789 RepID=UPI0021FA24C2|nr:hypothetical protein [Lactococcus petauri]USI65779.1 hypothetical protein LMK05_00500 [Lactococcus petauri]WJE12900.1 hypothetical protein QR692_00460 [Lactococcus petauri]
MILDLDETIDETTDEEEIPMEVFIFIFVSMLVFIELGYIMYRIFCMSMMMLH